jgi:hypothetical protein
MSLNCFVLTHIRAFEMTGVLMRIVSFSLVSWLGPASPFLFVWIFNTIDAVLLSWCALLKRDQAYTVLNVFWIFVGFIGILRSTEWDERLTVFFLSLSRQASAAILN